MELTTKRRQEFRGQAHSLKPIIWIGGKGLTPEVHNEIEQALETHQLIKIKINDHDRDAIKAMVPEICGTHLAEHIQTLGHVITIWRKKKKV
jgi:RNA-binding protein